MACFFPREPVLERICRRAMSLRDRTPSCSGAILRRCSLCCSSAAAQKGVSTARPVRCEWCAHPLVHFCTPGWAALKSSGITAYRQLNGELLPHIWERAVPTKEPYGWLYQPQATRCNTISAWSVLSTSLENGTVSGVVWCGVWTVKTIETLKNIMHTTSWKQNNSRS